MMRILRSPWSASLIGTVAYLGTLLLVWLPHAHPLVAARGPRHSSIKGPSWTFQNPEVDLLIAELKKQKETLALKEKELNERAAAVQNEHAELMQLTQRVHQAQVEFDSNVVRIKSEETANLKRLAKLYAAMSPEGASAVFNTMDDTTLVKVMNSMKETETAPILENLASQGETQAKRVADLTEKLRLAFVDSKQPPGKPAKR